MTASLTIRNGRLALPDGIVDGDLQIVDGKITAVGEVGEDVGEVIDARNLLVMPGVVDPQVHFRDPGMTHKEDLGSGSRAAASGGVTSFLEMPNTRPNTITHETMAAKKEHASNVCSVNYGFFIGATPDNLEVLNTVDNVCGIKVFMAASTGSLLVSSKEDQERIFANGTRLIAVHGEDQTRLLERAEAFKGATDPVVHSDIRDAKSALLATTYAMELSEKYNRRLHILHLTTGDEVRMIREKGKGDGRVSVEVCPQHLLLNAPEIYERIGTKAQMNPPLRTKEHSEELWRGLLDGTIDCIATDHAPHTLEEKAQPFGKAPSGMPGVETSLTVMLNAAHQGRCTVEQVVRWMCRAPAELYSMVGKGQLVVGFDGDVCLTDLKRTERVGDRGYFTKVGWSPYDGMEMTGWPVMTIVGGQVVFRDNEIQPDVRGTEIQFAT